MNIGINGYYLGVHSGIGEYSFQLLSGLSEIDTKNKYFIFTPRNINLSLGRNFQNIYIKPVRLLSNTFINRYFWEEFQLGDSIKRYSIEIFHSPYPSIPRNAEKVRNIVTIHDTIPWVFPYYKNDFQYWMYLNIQKKNILKRARSIITDSKKSKEDIARVYNVHQKSIDVIYPAIDPKFFNKPLLTDSSKIQSPYMVYSGGFQRHKNLKNLILSFKLFTETYKYSGKLYVLGDIRKNIPIASAIYEDLYDLKKLIHSHGLSNTIVFKGYVPREDYILYIKNADFFISLSLYEGFGLPALESISLGTPCILSKNGVYEEIEHGAALYVNPHEPMKIAEVMNRMITDNALKNKLKKKGIQIASKFNRIQMASEILKKYR